MIAKLRKLRDQKGFTLVELIVVLVILAILAALLVPALTGYIDKANERSATAECRMAVMAAQTIASEKYAQNETDAFTDATKKAANITRIKELAEVPGAIDLTVADGHVTKLVYTPTSGTKSVTYTKDVSKGTTDYDYAEPSATPEPAA